MIKTYLFSSDGCQEDVQLDNWKELIQDPPKLLWVDVRSMTDDDINTLAHIFGLHDIEVQSSLDEFRRPHLYEFSDHFYVNLTTVHRNGGNSHPIKPSELNLFVGQSYIITATRDAEAKAVDEAVKDLKATPNLCDRGPMYGVYRLAEYLVETYTPITDKMDEEADRIESMMLTHPDKSSLQRLSRLKRQVFNLRKYLGPQRDVFNELARRDFPFISGEQQIYFQDVYNRMIRLFDMLDTVREILSSSLDIYLSSVSNRLNEIMKVLTVWSIALMMVSFITGFFGMNFTHLPWLDSPNAFRNIVIAMAGVVALTLWWFRRAKML